MAAVIARFGRIWADLAATAENAKAPVFFTPADDSLSQDWRCLSGNLAWLNPPFGHLGPWVRKAAECGQRVLVLVPASVGSVWFSQWVHRRAYVLALQPRVTFVGHTQAYPKDLLLCCYGYVPGFDVWRWK